MKTSIGIDLGGTNMRVALVSDDGKILSMFKVKTPVEAGPEGTAAAMAEMIITHRTQNPGLEILGVGIGSPGPLSRDKKMIFQTPNLPGFDGFPLGTRVQQLGGLPVWLDNDAKCATYGEGAFGMAKGLRNYILLTFGTGIGSGIVSDGKMIYGKSDGACETGHMTIHPSGAPCGCGNRGCFEQYCSATAIRRRATKISGRDVGTKDLIKAWENKEPWTESILREVSVDLALAIASLVNIFDPDAIVFGGGVFSTGGGPLLDWVRDEIRTRCFASSQKGLRLAASSLGGDAGVLGAATLPFRA